jgi:hypothetical protein
VSGGIDGRVIFERAPEPHRRELRRMVAEGWTDEEILEAWGRLLHNLTLRGQNEITAAAAYLRGQPTPEAGATRDQPLTREKAIALRERYGSYRKAADHSPWEASHINRVANGERGKRSD